jgi:hypothetical protein
LIPATQASLALDWRLRPAPFHFQQGLAITVHTLLTRVITQRSTPLAAIKLSPIGRRSSVVAHLQ